MELLRVVIRIAVVAYGKTSVLLKRLAWSSPNCTGSVIRIGTPLTLDCCSYFSIVGHTLLQTYDLFFQWLHKERGGIWIDGVQHCVELSLGDDESEPTLVAEITEQLLYTEGISLFLAPVSSSLALPMATLVNNADAVMVSGAVGLHADFFDRPRVFGTTPPESGYLASAFQALANTSHHQLHSSILNSTRRAASQPSSVVEVSLGRRGACSSVESLYAKQYNMTYLGRVEIDSRDQNNLTRFDRKVEEIIEFQPELVVGCNLDNTVGPGILACTRLVQEFYRRRFVPKALVFTHCLDLPEFRVELGLQADSVMGVTNWRADLNLKSELTHLSSAEFRNMYKRSFDVESVPYASASAWAAAEALVHGIQKASSTDAEEVAVAMTTMDIQSVQGRIAFDENGRCLHTFSTVQFQGLSPTPLIVWPPSDSTPRLIYPLPSSAELACFRNDSEDYDLYGIDPTSQQCEECPPGRVSYFTANLTHASGRRCEPCQPGKFRGLDEKLCTTCLRGYAVASFGAFACDACPSGKYAAGEGNSQCTPCWPGSVVRGTGAGRCFDCKTGTVATNTSDSCMICGPGTFASIESFKCEECSPGRFADGVQNVRCADCEAGHFSVGQKMTACVQCDLGRYQSSQGTSACIGCASNPSSQDSWITMRTLNKRWTYLEGATDKLSCGCDRGFRLQGGECIQCGEGMDCRHMGEPMRILEGFYSASLVSVYHCSGDKQQCPGGTPGYTCAAGRTGISCAVCERLKREGANGTCTECGGMDWVPLFLLCFVVVFVFGVIYFSLAKASKVARSHTAILAMIACTQITVFMQQLGVIGMFDIEFPETLKPFLALLQILNFDVRLINVGCFADPSGLGRFLAGVSAFFVVVVIMSLIHVLFVCLLRIRKWMPLYIAAIGTVCLLVFIPVASTVLRPLSCSLHPNGKWTVRTLGDVVCWENKTDNDHQIMVIVGLVGLLFPLGFLAFVAKIVLQVPHKLSTGDADFLNTYSFMLARFRPSKYWYIIIVLGRSLLISIIPVLPNAVMQILCFDMCNKAFVAGLIHFKPWRVVYSNQFDIFCSSMVLFMVNISALLVRDDDNFEVLSWVFMVGISTTILSATFLVIRCLIIIFGRKRKRYKFFLCHHKARAGAFARLLKMALLEHQQNQSLLDLRDLQLRQYTPVQVFLDSDDLSQLDHLFHTVGHEIENLVIIGTPDVFLRPWCAGEMTVARLKHVKVTVLAMPGWHPPDDLKIHNFSQLVDMSALNENGISLQMVQTTMRWLARLPVIQIPSELDSLSLHSLAGLLTSGAQEGAVDFHSLSSRWTPSSDDELGLIILVDDTDMDRVAAAEILGRLIRLELIEHSEGLPTVHRASEVAPLQFESIIVMCTVGCFDHPGFLEVLLQACSVGARVLPVIVDPNFKFPTQEDLAEMCSRPSLVPGATMVQISGMITSIFKEIAAVFQPQHASDTILQVNANQIAQRILSRMCSPIRIDRPTEESAVRERFSVRLSCSNLGNMDVDQILSALQTAGVDRKDVEIISPTDAEVVDRTEARSTPFPPTDIQQCTLAFDHEANVGFVNGCRRDEHHGVFKFCL